MICVCAAITLLDHRDAPTSLLVLIALIIGLLPVAGYLHLPSELNVLALVISTYVGIRLFRVFRETHSFNLSGLLVVSPALLAGIFTYWWWSEFLKGGKEEILTRFMPQWDSSAHFMIFSTIFREGVYPSLSSPPIAGAEWAGTGYPAGIHYVWSQFALSLRGASDIDRSVLVPFFGQAVFLTGATSVAVLSLAFARLGKSLFAQILGGVLGAALGTALFCAGPLSITFWGGFANVSAVVIGIAIFVSFLLNPHRNNATQLWVLAFCVSILVFNWYPTLAIFLPVLCLLFVKSVKRRKHEEIPPLIALCLFASQPVIHALEIVSKGVDGTLGAAGSAGSFPDTLLVGGSILALGLAVLLLRRLTPEFLMSLSAPALLLYGLGRFMLARVGELRYFFDKFGLFVGTYLLILTLGMLIHFGQKWLVAHRLSRLAQLRVTMGAVLISAAVLQLFGYWGPEIRGFESATVGPIQRSRLTESETKASDFGPLSAVVISESITNRQRGFDDRACALLVLPKRLATDAAENEYDLVFGNVDPGNAMWLANVWLHALSDSATTEFMALLPRTTELGRIADDYPALPESLIDETVEMSFSPEEVCILSTESINAELRGRSERWRTYDIGS